MNKLHSGMALALLICSGGITGQAQSRPTNPNSDRVIIQRPEDPLNRDSTRPDRSVYEVSTTATGTPSQVEAAIKSGREAFEAKPPRYEDAEKYYLEAAKLNPKEARAYIGLGTVYAGQNRARDAIEAFQKAIELKPKLADSHFNLGAIFVAIGKKDEAMEQYTALENLDKKLAKKLKEMIEARFKA